jgi:hypothetical protein
MCGSPTPGPGALSPPGVPPASLPLLMRNLCDDAAVSPSDLVLSARPQLTLPVRPACYGLLEGGIDRQEAVTAGEIGDAPQRAARSDGESHPAAADRSPAVGLKQVPDRRGVTGGDASQVSDDNGLAACDGRADPGGDLGGSAGVYLRGQPDDHQRVRVRHVVLAGRAGRR